MRSEGETKASEIKTRYQERIDRIASDTREQAEQISSEAPSPDDPIEGAVKFDLDFGSHEEELIFHLPEITIKDQSLSMDLPQVTMKSQDWIFHTPASRMVLDCTPGVPETVCEWVTRDIGLGIKTDIYECHMRAGQEICLHIPEVFMQEQKISLDVPEVSMGTVEIVMGIPEVTMKETRIVITVPDITVTDIEAEIGDMQEKGQQLASQSKEKTQILSTQMKAEINQASMDSIQANYSCQLDSFNLKKSAALDLIDRNIAAISGALDSARAAGATEMAAGNEKALADLVSSRENAITQFDEAAAKMAEEMQKQLNTASESGLAVAILPAAATGSQTTTPP